MITWTKLKRNADRARLVLRVRNRSPLAKAVEWVRSHRVPRGGILTHHQSNRVTQEVTGYLISTLYAVGEKELACDLARWEASVQRPDGSFVAPGTDIPYTFDTAQVIRGFLAVLDDMPGIEENLRRACDYVAGHIAPDGEVLHDSYGTWHIGPGDSFSPYCNLYVLAPLRAAGERFSEPRYFQAVDRSIRYFTAQPDLVEFKPEIGSLSHIFGYMMEALAELGQVDLARKGLDQAAALQRADGAIPAYPGVEWVCSTGVAQLAIAWCKLGRRKPAVKALRYLESIQNPSGGFYGSYGPGGRYFPAQEISWAAKFFIDLHLLVGDEYERSVESDSLRMGQRAAGKHEATASG